MDSERPAADKTFPVRRMSLRRRILLLVFSLSVFPSAIILAVMTISAVRAIERQAVEEGLGALRDMAETIAKDLQAEVRQAESFAEAIGDMEEWDPDLPARLPTGSRVYTIAEDKAVFAADGASVPDALARELAALAGTKGAASFVHVSAAERKVRILVPVVAGSARAAATWISVDLDPARLLQAHGPREAAGSPVLMHVSDVGRFGPASMDSRMVELIDREAGRTGEPSGLVDASEQDAAGPVAYARVALFSSLARPAGDSRPTMLLAARVPVGEATIALYYQFWFLALVGLVFIALVCAFGVWLADRNVEPVKRLRAGFLRLERGDLDYRVEVRTGDELEELANSMNRMAQTLQHTYRSLADKLLQLDEKARQLSMTYEISEAINRSLEPDILLHDIVKEIRALVPADLVVLTIEREEKPGVLETVYTSPAPRPGEVLPSYAIAGSLAASSMRDGSVRLHLLSGSGDSAEDKLFHPLGLRSLCVIPLRTPDETFGAMFLADSTMNAFRGEEMDVLRRIAPTLSTALQHSRLYASKKRFAEELERQVKERTAQLETAQQRLFQAEKLAATGELAANVAHEINNPLSIIKNYIRLIESQSLRPNPTMDELTSLRDSLGIIGEEIDRIARIVGQLRRLNIPHVPEAKIVNVNEELEQVVYLFRHTFTEKNIRIDLRLDSTLEPSEIFEDYLKQIMINLLKNSYEASSPGDLIAVQTIDNAPDSNHLTITVRDTGSGIAPENIGKVFDPFFSTKREGKGQGLGLSVSYGLARQMGGRLEVESLFGHWTEFRLVLPRTIPRTDVTLAAGGTERRPSGERIILG